MKKLIQQNTAKKNKLRAKAALKKTERKKKAKLKITMELEENKKYADAAKEQSKK